MTETGDGAPLEGDVEAAMNFLLLRSPSGPLHLCAIHPDKGGLIAKTFQASEIEAAREFVRRENGHRNLYVHVNPLKAGLHDVKAKKSDVGPALWAHVDIDDLTALNRLGDFLPAPTAVVCSGGGYNVYWAFREAVPDLAHVERINRWLVERLDGDRAAIDVSRILRLPGTVNLPNETKRKKGRSPSVAYVVRDLTDWSRRYAPEEFGERDEEDRSLLSGQPIDPVRSSKLDSEITGSRKDIAGAIRQAYCIVVTRGADDTVHAFKVTVDTNKPLFQTIKEDPKSRITDLPLTPDAILPGSTSGFDLWREDEDRRRVKTIVGAFAERPKLPKMLRRKDLLDTVSNGCVQGLYVLSLPRPDGSARTWWRMPIDEATLTDDALEAVQNSAAILDSLDPFLLVPGRLEGLDWTNGLRVADLITYFDGHILTIDHADEGWTEEKPIPRCPEAKVLEAVGAAVKAGTIWLTSGTASVWGEQPPPGIVSKTAVLRAPPHPIDVSSLTPEALPDAWIGGDATAHSIEQAVAAQRGVTSMPWKLVESAITGALNAGFIRIVPGGAPWPSQPHEAAAVQIRLPTLTSSSDTNSPVFVVKEQSANPPNLVFREAVLDSNTLTELVEGMSEVLSAAGNLTLRFRVAVEFGEGEVATHEVAAKLAAALEKAGMGKA